jgi:hypothetical protein
MDAVDREELIGLLAEALMRDAVFRPRRRHRAADADRRQLEARMCGGSCRAPPPLRHPLVAPPARAAA